MAITLIDDAVIAGARCVKACEIIGLSERTLRRWRSNLSLIDKRQTPAPRTYEHALTEEEKVLILTISNSDQFKSLPPTQIVPKLADRGVYIPVCQPKHEPTDFEITYKSGCLGERNAKANYYC